MEFKLYAESCLHEYESPSLATIYSVGEKNSRNLSQFKAALFKKEIPLGLCGDKKTDVRELEFILN